MLTAEGCLARRERLWSLLDPLPDTDYLLLSDPIHLTYLANYWADPISLGAGFPAFLLLRRDGHAKLIRENRAPGSASQAHVDETRVVPWYDGQSPGAGPRQLGCLQSVNPTRSGLRVHDRPGDPLAAQVTSAIAEMRRQKYADELDVLRVSMKAIAAGHVWALQNVKAGMSELDVYAGISAECIRSAGMPVIVYGDFAVSPGPERRGGPPTRQILKNGDMIILDYSVVVHGYRGDYTNTMVVGGAPNPEQQKLYDHCRAAMAAGEAKLRDGATCLEVYQAVRGSFDSAGVGEYFPHHAGHGIGLTHPEDPFIVRNSTQTLRTGDVVTLEPGMYVRNAGGIRIEHNYLITPTGFEKMSLHDIRLT